MKPPEIRSRAEALKRLGDAQSVKLMMHTVLELQESGDLLITYYGQPFINYTVDGHITLALTVCTIPAATRIHRFSPFVIANPKGLWRVIVLDVESPTGRIHVNKGWGFQTGMTWTGTEMLNAMDITKWEDLKAVETRLDDYCDAFSHSNFTPPECYKCALVVDGIPLPVYVKDVDHIMYDIRQHNYSTSYLAHALSLLPLNEENKKLIHNIDKKITGERYILRRGMNTVEREIASLFPTDRVRVKRILKEYFRAQLYG